MVVKLIANGCMEGDRDAHAGQFPAQPLAVGIECLTADKLAADRQDFGPSWHLAVSLHGGRMLRLAVHSW